MGFRDKGFLDRRSPARSTTLVFHWAFVGYMVAGWTTFNDLIVGGRPLWGQENQLHGDGTRYPSSMLFTYCVWGLLVKAEQETKSTLGEPRKAQP